MFCYLFEPGCLFGIAWKSPLRLEASFRIGPVDHRLVNRLFANESLLSSVVLISFERMIHVGSRKVESRQAS